MASGWGRPGKGGFNGCSSPLPRDWVRPARSHRVGSAEIKVMGSSADVWRRLPLPGPLPVSAENLCHQAIFVDDAACAVVAPNLEMIQVGDAIWQEPQWRGLVQGAVRPAGVAEVLVVP
jgi:hypothetical protein